MPRICSAFRIRAIISIVSFVVACGSVAAAQINHTIDSARLAQARDNQVWRQSIICGADIHLEGDIKPGDTRRLSAVIKEVQAARRAADCDDKPVMLHLDSEGGVVDEALSLGRLVRQNSLITRVDHTKSCASSCVFVFASGVDRLRFGGFIGIHRPYFAALSANLTYQQVQEKRLAIVSNLKAFAREMDFSEKLIDDMLAIEPSDIKLINQHDHAEYRIWGKDATWEEREVAKYADAFGIDSMTYRRRLATTERLCGEPTTGPAGDARSDCYISIMADISVDKASRFRDRYHSECKQSDTRCAKRVLNSLR